MLILITILMQSLLNYGWRAESFFLLSRRRFKLATKMWFSGFESQFRLFTWVLLVLWRPWGANDDKSSFVLPTASYDARLSFFLSDQVKESWYIRRQLTICLFRILPTTVLRWHLLLHWWHLQVYVVDFVCAYSYTDKMLPKEILVRTKALE